MRERERERERESEREGGDEDARCVEPVSLEPYENIADFGRINNNNKNNSNNSNNEYNNNDEDDDDVGDYEKGTEQRR